MVCLFGKSIVINLILGLAAEQIIDLGLDLLPLGAFQPFYPVLRGLPIADNDEIFRIVHITQGFTGNIALLIHGQRPHFSEKRNHLP